MIKHRALIGLLLIAALVLRIFFPLHFHSHHSTASEPQGYEHVISYHLLTGYHITVEHLVDEGTHELKTIPDMTVKKHSDTELILFVDIVLLALLPVILVICPGGWLNINLRFIANYYYSLAPPLRGPPAI